MTMVVMSEMTEFMQEDIILQDLRKPYNIEVEVYVGHCRATAPVRGIVLYRHLIIYEPVSCGEFGEPRREFGLCLPAHGLDFIGGRNDDIAEFLLLLCNGREDPIPAGHEEGTGDEIRYGGGHCDRNALDGMDTDAHSPASGTLAKCHLSDLGIHVYFTCRICHL